MDTRVYSTHLRQNCDSNKSVQVWRNVILRNIFCADYVQNKEEKYRISDSEAGRDAPAMDMLVLNKPSLGT